VFLKFQLKIGKSKKFHGAQSVQEAFTDFEEFIEFCRPVEIDFLPMEMYVLYSFVFFFLLHFLESFLFEIFLIVGVL
jgi:hypothetical protein